MKRLDKSERIRLAKDPTTPIDVLKILENDPLLIVRVIARRHRILLENEDDQD